MKFGEKGKEICMVIGIFLVEILALYAYLFRSHNPVFGINDDWTVYMVLSGSYLGTPDPYVVFFLYPLAWLVCKLYEITNLIPWYGLLLHGCFILSGFWIFLRTWQRVGENPVRSTERTLEKYGKKIVRNTGKYPRKYGWKLLISTGVLLLFFFFSVDILLTIQYTHSAAICGAAAVFLFLTSDTKEKDWKGFLWANIPTLIMAALAVCIRKNAGFMCIPVGGMLFLAKWWLEERKLTPKALQKYLGFAAMMLGLIGGLLISHEIAYSSEEWSEYADVNYYREKVVDFYGMLPYEEMADVAEEIGMSRQQYEISSEILNFYTGDIPYSQFLKIMMERSKANYDAAHPLPVKFQNANASMLGSLLDDNLKPQNTMFLIMAAGLLIFCAYYRQWNGFLLFFGYLFGRFFAWYYILFNGRFPLRISQCLFLIDFMAVLAIWLYLCGDRRENETSPAEPVKRKLIPTVAALLFAVSLALAARQGLRFIGQRNSYIGTYQDRWYGIKEYCMQRPENMYLLNGASYTLFYFSDNVLDTNTIGQFQNYYANSNFYSTSPNFYKKTGIAPGRDVAEALLLQENNYWIYEAGYFGEDVSIVRYYKERYPDFAYELVDTFATDTSSFEVYRFGHKADLNGKK